MDLGVTSLPVPLSVVGAGGTTTATLPAYPGVTVMLTGGPFVTERAIVTDITTTRISLPDRGGVTGFAVTLVPTDAEQLVRLTTMGGVTVTAPGGYLQTQSWVTLEGTNDLASAGAGGTVTFVTPMRVSASQLPFLESQMLPGMEPQSELLQALSTLNGTAGAIHVQMEFVPEPSTSALLASGSALLVVLGARKRRRR